MTAKELRTSLETGDQAESWNSLVDGLIELAQYPSDEEVPVTQAMLQAMGWQITDRTLGEGTLILHQPTRSMKFRHDPFFFIPDLREQNLHTDTVSLIVITETLRPEANPFLLTISQYSGPNESHSDLVLALIHQ